ncbi:hypothetical protein OG258_19925 [Streptomyces mirabilis]|uniref:hypothetical protein n=1 Tax=Streptomyces mirabilis TaxID=68239 RepID=UPI002E27FE28|nr:hypothetical protein [Streptomyces mirabilis]
MSDWIRAFDGGRVNLGQATALLVGGSGSVWVVNAKLTDGTSVKILDNLPSKADAVTAIDDLLLNGS